MTARCNAPLPEAAPGIVCYLPAGHEGEHGTERQRRVIEKHRPRFLTCEFCGEPNPRPTYRWCGDACYRASYVAKGLCERGDGRPIDTSRSKLNCTECCVAKAERNAELERELYGTGLTAPQRNITRAMGYPCTQPGHGLCGFMSVELTVDGVRDWAMANLDTTKCAACGTAIRGRGRHHTPDARQLDHIVPLSRGGEHCIDNVQWLCHPCNNTKRDDEDWQYEEEAS